jgi:hypothetical protein
MKKYEMVRQLFNSCAGNQKNGVLFKQIETDNLDAFFKGAVAGPNVSYSKEVTSDGSVVFHVDANGINQRYTFTEI